MKLSCARLQDAAISPVAEAAAAPSPRLGPFCWRQPCAGQRAQARLMRGQHRVKQRCTEILDHALYPSLQLCSALTNCRYCYQPCSRGCCTPNSALGASLLEAAVRRERQRAQARLMRIQHNVKKRCTEILDRVLPYLSTTNVAMRSTTPCRGTAAYAQLIRSGDAKFLLVGTSHASRS